ncbi:MAG TPA: hypothetical protein VFI47_13710, partial [Acidimicrobiales bacterium]|nr:hypothetical protein [Acidimicrobiales bacterium]
AGVVFDYRLRVTWVAPMLALVMVCWTGWIELRARRPGLDARRLARPALGCLVAVSVVNGVTAAAERPHETPSAAIASLTGQVLDALDDLPGDPGDPVLVVSPFDMAEWYVSGLVLQLERRGVDARVTRPHSEAMGAHRAIEGDPRATLVVVSEDLVAWADGEPGLVPVATWASPAADDVDRGVRRWMDLMTEADTATGARRAEVMRELRGLELPRNPAAEAKAYLFATDGPYSLRANVYLVVDDGAAAAAPSAPAG